MADKPWLDQRAGFLNCNPTFEWMKICSSQHKRTYKNRSIEGNIGNLDVILIDVVEHRIIRRRSRCKYLAVSYVRGGITMPEATQENVERLQTPGALATLKDQLPQTVQDAMELTIRLGEKYLWLILCA